MSRRNGTDRNGGAFNIFTVQAVWEKAKIIPNVDPNVRRLDACDAVIERNQYGVTTHNGTGWEIDHIIPVAQDGSDNLSNLQPLQWQNNRQKGDSMMLSCAVSARR